MNDSFTKFIPEDKSWLTRVGVLDIINGYTDIEKFIDQLSNANEDVLAIRNASKDWRSNSKIRVGESATLYRLLRFAAWKMDLNKTFIIKGSLKKRHITNNPEIIKLKQKDLLKLDNETTQWATASVICGDLERLPNPPLKLKETYEAVDHWNLKRGQGLCWDVKYDVTIERQAHTFLMLLKNKPVDYTPLCSDDYCFARVFDFINKESGAKFWPSLIGHETNRIEEMEIAIKEAESTLHITSEDHRVIQALSMWGVLKNKNLIFKHKKAVNKSWPLFWDFLEYAKKESKNENILNDTVVNKTHKDILGMISQEVKKENDTISLIPSENIMSKLATSAYTLNSNNRYIIKSKIGSRYFMPGRENLGNLISILEKKLCQAYNVEFCITKGLSGIHNMDIVMSAINKISNKIIIIDTLSGGHSKTKGIAIKNGFQVETIKIDFDTWDLDYKILDKLIKKWEKESVFIYIDHTVSVNPLDMHKLVKKVPSKWIIYYDISHLQLFYFTQIFKFPRGKNFFFGGSTHKTFPGPQKSIVLLNNRSLYELVDSEFVKNTSSVHTGSLLALLITVIEMEKFGKKYAEDILLKTRKLAKLLSRELDVIGPKPTLTNTHQICIDVPNIVEITQRLASVGIITMPMRTPSKNKSGLRLGIQELCRLGLKDKHLETISKAIITCVKYEDFESQKRNIYRLAKKLNNIKYTFPNKKYF
ncbi:hypothetical protein H6790_00345 [Candidatus Nomurabacteria bacterium]|nr:hypothetical protein [Candidatus Nomurabacteria bacterium]MCB9820385.1 hypothetical protein [Candidatus Nomurabacteria bacterium]